VQRNQMAFQGMKILFDRLDRLTVRVKSEALEPELMIWLDSVAEA